jgi:hypothetical protein
MKTFVKLSMVMAATGFITISTFGQKANEVTDQKQQTVTTSNEFVQGTFVDKDKNGVCDNYESAGRVGAGRNFMDKNGDGVCDNQGKYLKKGRGQGNRNHGANYFCRGGNRGNGNGYCRHGLR